MKLGIVLYSSDSETVWNAFRLGNFALKEGDEVRVFLLAKGVEFERLDSETFRVREQAQNLVDKGGKIYGCGTCLKLRKSEGSALCPVSTLRDLYQLIRECEKVVTF